MIIYLAAPWKHREAARQTALVLESKGHEITEPWWDHEDVSLEDPDAVEELADQASLDYYGVLNAELLLLLNLEKSEGKAVEQGIALLAGLPILAIGSEKTNVFQHLPCYKWVGTLDEALEELEVLENV